MKKMPTTYNDLPARIDEILAELNTIKVLLGNMPKPEQVPKYLGMDDAVSFLQSHGIKISKSTLYKRISSGCISSIKIENRNYFTSEQLKKAITNGNI